MLLITFALLLLWPSLRITPAAIFTRFSGHYFKPRQFYEISECCFLMDKNQCNSTSLCQHNWPLGIEGSDSIVISWKWQVKSEQKKCGTLDSVSMCTQFHSWCFSHRLPAFPLIFVSDPAYHVWFCPRYLSRCYTALLLFSQYSSIPSVFFSFLVWNWCFVPPLSGGALTQLLKWTTKPCCFVFCGFCLFV